jgi:hypothetical protein
MCFSASASFTSATALLVAGGICASRADERRNMLYALVPVMFGMQQFIEGLIWLALKAPDKSYGPLSIEFLTMAYSVFSQVLWPVYIPLAIWMFETVAWRRKAILMIGMAGLLVSVFLLGAMLDRPVIAQVEGQHIAYVFAHLHVIPATLLYLLGTCLAPLLSSSASVRLFGIAALISSVITYAFYATWFISVWCFFAGLLSCIVFLKFVNIREKDV